MRCTRQTQVGGNHQEAERCPPSASYRLFCITFSLAYGFALSQIPGYDFKDWANYIIFAEASELILLGFLSGGLVEMLANEPLWLLLNIGLALFLEPDTVVRTIIFGSAFTVSWLVLRQHPHHAWWLLIFLLLPVVVKNHLIHIRQGAAIALFLAGWFCSGRLSRALLMGLSPFVHASFFFVLMILVLARLFRQLRLGPDLRTIAFIGAGIAVGLGLFWVAYMLGARQALQYQFAMTYVSGLGFVFWSTVVLLMFMQGRAFLRERAFETGTLLFYLATYFLIEVTARIFESSLLLVLLAGLAMTGWRLAVFRGVMLFYGGMSWLMRFSQPALGFGIG